VKKSKSDAVDDASQGTPELGELQIAEIIAALKEADAGNFATEHEVQVVLRKWRRRVSPT
jgi:predicted transcriptional regulator